MDAAATSTVTFTVTDLARIEGAGRLAALAAVELELDGIALTVQGVRVVRRKDRVTTEAPRYRDPRTGQWLPALILPEELGAAIAREVHRMLRTPPADLVLALAALEAKASGETRKDCPAARIAF